MSRAILDMTQFEEIKRSSMFKLHAQKNGISHLFQTHILIVM